MLAVIGTRPEAIKQAPVVLALQAHGLTPTLLLTGQHPSLDPAAYGLHRFPTIRLACPGQPDPHEHAAQVAERCAPHLRGAALVIVQGDTSSALGGALAAFARGVPVAHVEAGLRSFDFTLPWPEEGNRFAIDSSAALLFAPTETSAANLRAEAVPGAIHVTGNTAIDALRHRLGRVPVPRLSAVKGRSRLLVTCHRRENWGAAFDGVSQAVAELASENRIDIDFLVPPNPAMAARIHERLGGLYGVRLCAPLDHGGMIDAMRSASLILSDSGGIQEEAPALGTPLLVLRDRTERPEGVVSGNMLLVGSCSEKFCRRPSGYCPTLTPMPG
ncbi:non-hydrolyzing UDP-N-acetylglucosamine 2-epimerase [Sphingomonas sp. GCM10030256]|uniref:non-hydrolyzing UDP-N-acetylglucosamine 2-epimerase n=1 Tax=Sphingomonas sp. GCM10030256 TaxID=3273427 RepID=UPI00360AC12F